MATGDFSAQYMQLDTNSMEANSDDLRVKVDAAGAVERTASGVNIKALSVTDGMLAGSIAFSKLADSANIARLDQAESIAAIWDFGGNTPTITNAPTSDNQAANKGYVDSVAQGLKVKDSVVVRAQGDITLSGPGATIDGITMAVDDRFLADQQGTGTQDGIYLWKGAAVAAVRTTDAAVGADFSGVFLFVEEGTDADQGFVCTNDSGSDIVGTDALTFTQFSGVGAITAGVGMTKSGSTLNVGNTGTPAKRGGINFTSDDLAVYPDDQASATIAPVTVSANGTGVVVDNDTVVHTTGTLSVGGNSIGAAEIDETDTYDYSASGVVNVATQTTGNNTTLAASTAFVQQEITAIAAEEKQQRMHLVTAGEDTAGYFTIPSNPVNAQCVALTFYKGNRRVNKQVVGATGASPDFDVLNTNELHINNNGAATGLTGKIKTGDIVILDYTD